jgi:3-hydroxyisobutyrate dehydrogenase
MAANLVKAGFDVTDCDATPGRAAQFAAEVGGMAAADAAAAAEGVDAFICIVPTSKQVAEVAAQVGPVLAKGALLILEYRNRAREAGKSDLL